MERSGERTDWRSSPSLFGLGSFPKINGPCRKLLGELSGQYRQFLHPILAEFQIIGVPHHMAKPLEFTHRAQTVLRYKCRSNSRQRQRQPLNQPLMVIALFVKVILKAVANSLQNLLQDVVEAGQFVCAGLKTAIRAFIQSQLGFARSLLDHRAIGLDLLEQHRQPYGIHVSPSRKILSRKRLSDSNITS